LFWPALLAFDFLNPIYPFSDGVDWCYEIEDNALTRVARRFCETISQKVAQTIFVKFNAYSLFT
jgi:hypothetical protein